MLQYDAIKKCGIFKNLHPLDTHNFRVKSATNPGKERYGPDFMIMLSLKGLGKPGVFV